MTGQLLLGVDIGTASSKGVLTTTDGQVVARASQPHQVSTPRPGWVEHDADMWWSDFSSIVRQLVSGIDPGRLAGIGVSGIGPCLLPADQAGTPLRPAILYGVDTRATAEIDELNEELGAELVLRRCGSPLTTQAVGPKLRWLARHEPAVYARTDLLLMASSFLVHRLTGRYLLDHHSASQCQPMYDIHARRWDPKWSVQVAPGLDLPELAWPGEVVGTVTAEAAGRTGLPAGLPVTAGTVDAWAEAVSVGVRADGDTMVMYGTTMFLVQAAQQPSPHPGLWNTVGVDPGSYTLAAGMATSGAITDWLRRLTGGNHGDYAQLVEAAGEVPAGSRGLLMLPYFAGERTPLFDPDARGVLAGLTLRHGPAEVYRSALEATAYGVRHNLEAMAGATSGRPRLVAVGGGTQGGLWTQIVSDVTGLDQLLPTETVGACLGDALLAGQAVGAVTDPAAWNPARARITPDPRHRETYDRYYPRYRALYEATREVAHFCAREQHKEVQEEPG